MLFKHLYLRHTTTFVTAMTKYHLTCQVLITNTIFFKYIFCENGTNWICKTIDQGQTAQYAQWKCFAVINFLHLKDYSTLTFGVEGCQILS